MAGWENFPSSVSNFATNLVELGESQLNANYISTVIKNTNLNQRTLNDIETFAGLLRSGAVK